PDALPIYRVPFARSPERRQRTRETAGMGQAHSLRRGGGTARRALRRAVRDRGGARTAPSGSPEWRKGLALCRIWSFSPHEPHGSRGHRSWIVDVRKGGSCPPPLFFPGLARIGLAGDDVAQPAAVV